MAPSPCGLGNTLKATVVGQRIPSYQEKGRKCTDDVHRRLQHLVSPHVESFNYMLDEGLAEAVADIPNSSSSDSEDLDLMETEESKDSKDDSFNIKLSFEDLQVEYPERKDLTTTTYGGLSGLSTRERGLSYTGAMSVVTVIRMGENGDEYRHRTRLGDLPIMVCSSKCKLQKFSPEQMIANKEEANEKGGYFICNGIERVVRLLQVPRRNHAMAIQRSSFRNRGNAYSDLGVTMRCVRPDQSSITITLHYLNNGGSTMKFTLRKQEFLLPVVVVAKALVSISDKELFDRIVLDENDNTFLTTRIEVLLPWLGSLFPGAMLIDRYFFVHCGRNDHAKLECLLHMIRKLFSFAQGRCCEDNADALMNHELLLPETIILIESIGTFLSTGNIVSNTGLDLMQVSGYTIVAERLNIFRYMSHFQSVHRGQFFTTMKTTTVRKLLPESWGFLCPVHTPDGSPCGLLNHLARECTFLNELGLKRLLVKLGMLPSGMASGDDADAYLDPTLELAYLPVAPTKERQSIHCYPGLYMFTSPGRMIRPVMNLQTKTKEYIGPMEQPYMEIASDNEQGNNATTHIELDPTQMLSHIAALTPYSDQNQSPRNMYQCQMGKQTMGTPAHALKHRTDNKLYRIQNPQAPIVQTQTHRDYCMDEYPQGTNAVVCVIAYTGYDMEDAMIINRSAFQRGFGHGVMVKTITIDLAEEEKRASPPEPVATSDDTLDTSTGQELDADGLPYEGVLVKYKQPICCIVDTISGEHRIIRHKSEESCYVETVRMVGSPSGKASSARTVSITFRYPRQPVIGDKFSSRHGQKGTLGVLWPQQDMPFTESGMSPDILINPHAFPSRMTIGMLIESMAGKAGAMHGNFQDATPFRFHDQHRIVDSVGEQLVKSGFNYYGSEPLYSGISGKLMQVDIFIGLVYYQRLRHMVSDKSQARSTGAVQAITRQPVKGRKKGGGIRLGEMERDALLSHGVAFCLHDRLMNCSDAHLAYVCAKCGGLLEIRSNKSAQPQSKWTQCCNTCKTSENVKPVFLPYVYRYLTNELAGMGIRLSLQLKDV
eukprot:GSChrysophyteH1.ASY1.ANO1.3189.1 assembled CDS